MKSPYQVLGVDSTATADQIKDAYRVLVKRWHPDKNHGNKDAEEKFKEISAAYEVVGNVQKRMEFDRSRLHTQSMTVEEMINMVFTRKPEQCDCPGFDELAAAVGA